MNKLILFLFLTTLLRSAQLKVVQKLYPPEKCGKLNEKRIYTEDENSSTSEFPWMARIIYEDGQHKHTCLGAVVSRRHLITPALCVMQGTHNLIANYSVVLGEPSDYCSDNFNCAPPPPLLFDIEEIVIHPNFTVDNQEDDLAIVRVSRDIEFNDFIEPICQPPATAPRDYVTQHLYFVGLPYDPYDGNFKTKRQRALVHMTSRAFCHNQYPRSLTPQYGEQLCGFIRYIPNPMTGSLLMGINVINGAPKNYYLAGLVSINGRINSNAPAIFTPMAPYKDWISTNVV